MEGPRGNLDGVSAAVRKYADYAIRHADLRTCRSAFVAQDASDLYGIKPAMIMPVGVDTRVFSPPVVRNRQVATILFVGHLMSEKVHISFTRQRSGCPSPISSDWECSRRVRTGVIERA